MKLPDGALALLKLREGVSNRVYKDSLGFRTAGMGHLLSPSEARAYHVGDLVPTSILDAWADADAQRAYVTALLQAHELGVADEQHFVDVLCSVNFQLGTRWYRVFPTMWHLMMLHKWAEAAREVPRSRWAKQTPVRAQDLIDALLTLAERDADIHHEN